MDTGWFYLERGDRRGPVDLSGLLKALLAAPDPRKVKIWREGLPGWQDADSVVEISAKLPPPAPTLPVPEIPGSITFAEAERVATLYRRLVFLVAAQYFGAPVFIILLGLGAEASSAAALPLIVLGASGLIGIPVWILITSYGLMKRVGSAAPLVWVVGMFIPLINLLVLLGISGRANSWCKRYGIKVGLLGPTRESLERLRRMETA